MNYSVQVWLLVPSHWNNVQASYCRSSSLPSIKSTEWMLCDCFGAAFVVGFQRALVSRCKDTSILPFNFYLDFYCRMFKCHLYFPRIYRYWLSRSIVPVNEAHARLFYLSKVRHEGRYPMKERDAAPMAA